MLVVLQIDPLLARTQVCGYTVFVSRLEVWSRTKNDDLVDVMAVNVVT